MLIKEIREIGHKQTLLCVRISYILSIPYILNVAVVTDSLVVEVHLVVVASLSAVDLAARRKKSRYQRATMSM